MCLRITRVLFLMAGVVSCFAGTVNAQTLSFDLVRNGGLIELDSQGDFQWILQVTPAPISNPDAAEGDAIAIGGGVTLTDSPLIPDSAEASGEGLPFINDNNVFTIPVPYPAPPGFSFATGTAGINMDIPEGVIEGTIDGGIFLNGIFVGLGSDPLPAGTFDVLYFRSQGPAIGTLLPNASLTSSVSFAGELAQFGVDGLVPAIASESVTVLPGDVNLDGVIDETDLAIVDTNFGLMIQGGWAVGDLDRSGMIDQFDRIQVSSRIPEPSSVALCVLLLTATIAIRRQK